MVHVLGLKATCRPIAALSFDEDELVTGQLRSQEGEGRKGRIEENFHSQKPAITIHVSTTQGRVTTLVAAATSTGVQEGFKATGRPAAMRAAAITLGGNRSRSVF